MANSNIVFSMVLNNTDFTKKLNMSRSEIRQLERRVNSTTGTLSNMVKGGLAPMLGPLTTLAGSTAAVGMALSRATEKMIALDTAMAEMRALLGASAEQMERFKDAAIGMASSSTVAADEVIRAMIKVGGAMPQLLDFEEGLKAVTQSAVTLSEASGMTLDDSINSLTSMMNQFGAAAMDSERYINVLAAASQAGSAEIDYLSEAIAKAGGAATSADMEFEELVALIEAVAPKFGKAEEAGTALRGVLLKMETGGERTKISIQGLAKALDELSKMGTQELLKKFGVEGFNMAKAMIAAKDSFAQFNEEVRNTDAAHEQAQLRADNLATAIDALANKWDAFTLSLNNSAGPLKDAVNLLGKALDYASKLNQSLGGKQLEQENTYTKKGFDAASGMIADGIKSGKDEATALNDALAKAQTKIAKLRQGLNEGKYKDPDYDYGYGRKYKSENGKAIPQSFMASADKYFGNIGGAALSFGNPLGIITATLADKKRKKDINDYIIENPNEKRSAELELRFWEGAVNALLDKKKAVPQKEGDGEGEGGGSGENTFRTQGINYGKAPLMAIIEQRPLGEISGIQGQPINVANLSTHYDNPWSNRYINDVRNGDSISKTQFTADITDAFNNAISNTGSLIAEIPGLGEIGTKITEVSSKLSAVISVIQAVTAVIEMAKGIGAVSGFLGGIFGFSEGGIVGGSSWSGDKLFARVNSGEMVLNAKQQQNLLAGLNNGGSSVLVSGDSRAIISGETIYVSLSNYQKRTGKKL